MAEPTKPKQPSPSKKAQEPDFSPFDDWMDNDPESKWPWIGEPVKELTEGQKQIVAANAALLLEREAWLKKVQTFEAALTALADEALQKETRAKYHIRFDQHVFEDGLKDFSGYPFPCSVSFAGCNFGEGDVSFNVARFGEGDVWFMQATFGKGDIRLSGANFGEGNVRLIGANFGDGSVWLHGATFGPGEVWLHDATFGEGDIMFNDMVFQSTIVSAPGMAVAGHLYFRSHFPDVVNLSRLDIKGTISFSGSSFDKVPDFRDAKFEHPPEVAGMKVERPKLKGWNRLAADDEDVAKFRKLKAMALAANDHEKDGEFFAGEMLAKRGTETKTTAGLFFNTFYWKTSGFGQSFTLPIFWMLRAMLLFAAVNIAVISIGMPSTLATISSRFETLVFSTFLSLKNSVPLLGSLFRFAPAPEKHKSWFQSYYDTLKDHPATVDWLIGLGVVESILGGVLLFLFLLALRNQFRLK